LTSDHFFVRKNQIASTSAILQGEEHHHLARVARVRPGARICLLDEEGTGYIAEVEAVERERTRLNILERRIQEKPAIRLTLAQALLKSKNMEMVIQKSTELGVRIIIPVVAFRSVVRLDEKREKKVGRWQRIAREAAKQSKSPIVPSVLPPLPLINLVEGRDESLKLYLSENTGRPLRDIIVERGQNGPGPLPASVLIAVGPEGGWTREEEKLMLAHDFSGVSLGTRILRSETAALCAAAVISQFWVS
jgi:16S rRNA (uracil1498-N3)-methyltransferase